MNYSVGDACKVSKVLLDIILSQPEKLKTIGVFRESGDKNNIDEIIHAILKPNHSTIDIKRYSIHEYIGAIKTVLQLRQNRFTNSIFNEFSQKAALDPAKADITDLFAHLVQSEDYENILLAKTLYSYLQIAAMTFEYKEENKMSALNLGIIIGAAFSIDRQMMDFQELNDFAQQMIHDKQIPGDLSFHVYIANRLSEHLPLLIHVYKSQIQKESIELDKTKDFLKSLDKSSHEKMTQLTGCNLQLTAIKGSLNKLQGDLKPKQRPKKALSTEIKTYETKVQELTERIHSATMESDLIQKAKNKAQKRVASLETEIENHRNYLLSLEHHEMINFSKDFSADADAQLSEIKQGTFVNGTIRNGFFTRNQAHDTECDILKIDSVDCSRAPS